ncbi:MAG TPA: protein kinase, partial [Anaerolineae bacterium]
MQTVVNGARIGQYVIKAKVGTGTMGVVYLAEQPSMKRLVAIKFLPEETTQVDALQRFRREARMIARLEHPYVLPVYDFGHYEGNPYIVMRYMTGGTLLDQMVRGMSVNSVLHVLEQLARALDHAHRQGIIHRDLKPTNIFMDERGNAYLADFGLAKTLAGTEDITTTAQGFAGTPLYISPEQAGGEKLDHRTDIYSLGVITYQMLAGQPPYDDDTPVGTIMKHITAPIPLISKVVPGLPSSVDAVFHWVLAKDPADRPPTAMAFYNALRLALSDEAAEPDAETLRLTFADPATGDHMGTVMQVTAPGATRRYPDTAIVEPATAADADRLAGKGPVIERRWWLGGLIILIGLLAALAWARTGLFAPSITPFSVSTYEVGLSPRSVLYDGQAVWVVNSLDNQVMRLAAHDCDRRATSCGQEIGSYDVPGLPLDVAQAGDSVWVIGGYGERLLELDSRTGEVKDEHLLPELSNQLLSAHGFLWVSHTSVNRVSQLALDGTVVKQYPTGESPREMTADETAVWVANEGDNSLSRLHLSSGRVTPALSLPGQPLALAYAKSFLWVALRSGDVLKVDPASGQVQARLPASQEPVALLFAGERLWIADQESDTVIVVDVAADRVVGSIAVGDGPFALAWASCG